MTNVQDMTQGSPARLMLRFSLPLMLANVLQLLYVMADSAIVGRLLGVTAFAAVGVTASLYWFASGAIISIAHGFGIVLGQRFGAKDMVGLRRGFVTAFCLMAGLGAVVGVVGVAGSEILLVMLNTPPELLGSADIYLGWLLGGMVITAVYHLISSVLMALGDSKAPMRAMVVVSVVSVVLSFVLVSPLGIVGPAIALLLAQLAGLVYCAVVLCKTGVLAGGMGWDTPLAKELLRTGLPLGLRDSIIQAGGLVVQRHINNYGVEFIAGVAIAKRMYSLLFIASGGLEAAAATFSAQNFGAGRLDRVRQGVAAGVRLMLASAGIIMAATWLFGRYILALMFDGEAYMISTVLDVGIWQLMVLAVGLPVVHMLFLYRATLEGMGLSFLSMMSGFLEAGSRVAVVVLLTPAVGEWRVILSDPLGWLVAAVFLVVAYRIVYSQRTRPLKPCH